MVKMSAIYQGKLHCEATHGPSSSKLETDAPVDNQGLGAKFSPTDLVGTALGTCILTTIAIVAERDGLNIEGARAEVEKEMVMKPRRIGALKVHVTLPKSLDENQRRKLEETAHKCPVHNSLHPDVQLPISFTYA